jgi:hypothetical protein
MIRFPDGDYEYDMRRRDAPVVGETLHRLGVLWKVTKRTAPDGMVTIDVEPWTACGPNGHREQPDLGSARSTVAVSRQRRS